MRNYTPQELHALDQAKTGTDEFLGRMAKQMNRLKKEGATEREIMASFRYYLETDFPKEELATIVTHLVYKISEEMQSK